MKWFEYAIAIFACILLASATPFAYSIQGDCVVEETAYYKISQCPHTLTDFTNYPNISIWNKDSNAHAIDVAFGFDTSEIRPSAAWLWNENAPHQVPTYGNVSYSYHCVSPNVFSYQLNPKLAWCNSTNGTVIFSHWFHFGWIPNATMQWNEWGRNGTETQYWPDWVELTGAFSQADWNGKTWFYRENVVFATNETKLLKARVHVKPDSNGKYDLFAKLTSDSFQEAFDSGRYVWLDPWWNATWNYRTPLTIYEDAGLDRYQEPITVNVTGLTLATNNCTQELRLTANYSVGETELSYAIINASGQSATLGSQWCVIQWLVNMTTTPNASYTQKNVSGNYYAYHGNNLAVSPEYNASLLGWTIRLHGDVLPQLAGFVPYALSEVTSNYSFTLNENQILSTNDTGGGLPNATWLKTGTNLGNDSPLTALDRTIEWRMNLLAASGRYNGFEIEKQISASSHAYAIQVEAGKAGIGSGGDAAAAYYNTCSLTTTDTFHTYRAIMNDAATSYTLWVDGVYCTSGTNASTLTTDGFVLFGELYHSYVDTQNLETDYFYIKDGGSYPPLTATIGATETSTSKLVINCLDEQTGVPIKCDFTVSNSTNSSTITNSYYYNQTYPTGLITIAVSNASYYSRSYQLNFTDVNSTVTSNAYLLNASISAIFVRLHVSNAFSQPVSNASILIQRFVNGSNVVVSSLVTDSYGLASDYLELNHPYTVLVYAAGFNVYVSSILPILNDYYITLVSSSNVTIPVYDSYELGNTFSDVYWNLEPNTHSLTNETTNIVFSVVSPGSTLHYFGMNVSYANGSNVCFENVTNSSAGGIVSCLVLMDNSTLGDNVSVIVWISRSRDWVGDFIYWYKREAGRYVNTLTDFYGGMSDYASGADSTAMAFMVIVIATIAGLFVYQYHKTGALLVMLAILWLGAAAQFMNVNLVGVPIDGVYLMAFITVAVVGINFLREKI